MSEYRDRWISTTADGVRIRGYYFPWGSRHIAYADIRALRRVTMSSFRGRSRIWGSANPRYWAGLDPGRPSRTEALILDLGRWLSPFLTPDDPDGLEAAIRRHVALPSTRTGRAPVI